MMLCSEDLAIARFALFRNAGNLFTDAQVEAAYDAWHEGYRYDYNLSISYAAFVMVSQRDHSDRIVLGLDGSIVHNPKTLILNL